MISTALRGVLVLALFVPLAGINIAVFGGSGRVGGSVVRRLLQIFDDDGTSIRCVGRSEGAYNGARKRWAELSSGAVPLEDSRVGFVGLDLFNEEEKLLRAVDGADIVVHCAGPFQGLRDAPVLRAVLDDRLASRPKVYCDVCDDAELAMEAKAAYAAEAQRKGVAAILSTGTWPGASSLLAAELQQLLKAKHEASTEELQFNFFTSGSGGAGATVLAATFLILAEDARCYVDGARVDKKTCGDAKKVAFAGVGEKEVRRLNLLEAWSAREFLGVPNTETHFGTAPFLWNDLLAAMAGLLPKELLADKVFGRRLAAISTPIVYAVDSIFGTANGIRVDARGLKEGGEEVRVSATLSHPDLEACVGEAVAAFADAAAAGTVSPGVWMPEEAFSEDGRRRVLDGCARGSYDGIRYWEQGEAAVDVPIARRSAA